jgi:hypothetical protein
MLPPGYPEPIQIIFWELIGVLHHFDTRATPTVPITTRNGANTILWPVHLPHLHEGPSIGGRVPVLLKLDGSRPNFHMWFKPLRYRTTSRFLFHYRVVSFEVLFIYYFR